MTELARRLGTFDAVVIGLGSMIGAGVFAAFAPAAASAGALLLVGLALAAGVAYCNAVASAQLAAQYPTSGGTYVYGRERLGEWWGFLAGWGFVIGKTASCAAMALTFAAYAVPGPKWLERVIAAAAVVTLTGVNLRGITRTAGLTRILVAVSLVVLAIVVGVILGSGDAGTGDLTCLTASTACFSPRASSSSRSRDTRGSRRSAERFATRGGRFRVQSRWRSASPSPCMRSSPRRCCSCSARTRWLRA